MRVDGMQRLVVEERVSQSDLSTNDLFCSATSSIRDIQIPGAERKSSSSSGDVEKSITTIKNELASDESAKYQVTFQENDPENPLNWSFTKKFVIISVAILLIFNS